MDQRFRAALDMAELFLHHRAARSAEPLDAGPDPGRRDIVGEFIEFQPEQRRPQPLVDAAPAPGGDPVLGRDVFQAAPVAAPGREKHHGAVAQLLDQRQLGKLQQRHRIAPAIQRAVDVIAHRGRHPAHLAAEPEFGKQLEGRPVGFADEMKVALDRQAAEVEMRGHAARLGRGFEHGDGVAALGRVIAGGKTHGAGADDDHAAHGARTPARCSNSPDAGTSAPAQDAAASP